MGVASGPRNLGGGKLATMGQSYASISNTLFNRSYTILNTWILTTESISVLTAVLEAVM